MDKASPHHRSRKVKKYFEGNNETLIPVYLPTASPEFMVMEEVWNVAKRDLLVLKHYPSFQISKTGYPSISGQKDSGLIRETTC